MKKVFAILLILALSVSLVACDGVTSPSDQRDIFPLPNAIGGSTKRGWIPEEEELVNEIGWGVTDHERERRTEYAEIANASGSSGYDFETNIALGERYLAEATTGSGRLFFRGALSMIYANMGGDGLAQAVALSELSIDEMWRSGEWQEKFSEANFWPNAFYMHTLSSVWSGLSDHYAQSGEYRKAIETLYADFGAYNEAGIPVPPETASFGLKKAFGYAEELGDQGLIDMITADLVEIDVIQAATESAAAEAALAQAKENTEILSATVEIPYFPGLEITLTDVYGLCGEYDVVPGTSRGIHFYYGENTTISFNQDISSYGHYYGVTSDIITFKPGEIIRAADYSEALAPIVIHTKQDGSYTVGINESNDNYLDVGEMRYSLSFLDIQSYEEDVVEGYTFLDVREWGI